MTTSTDLHIKQHAALAGVANSDRELREIALDGILRLRDNKRRKRRQPWLRVLYIAFSFALYVAGSALFFVLMTARVRPSHTPAALGRNKTSNQNSQLVSEKQPLITMSR